MKRFQKNEGFTLIELLIVVAIIGIIAAIAIPGLLRARMSGNEASGIGTVRTISSAQATFASSCGGGGFATTLLILGTPPVGGVGFIPPDVVQQPKSGFRATIAAHATANQIVQAANCNGTANATTGFHVSNVPVTVGSTGTRSFATDHTGTIYQDATTASVIANPIVVGVNNVTILQ